MVNPEDDLGPNEAKQSRIVVGVDGSSTSFSALEWAAREARLRHSILEVVHATFVRQDALEFDSLAGLKEHERAILDEALAKASALAPGTVVVACVGDPPAAQLLVDVSKDAELLVVGSRGLGLFKEFTLGSVSQDCAHTAHCPLVIIGPRATYGAAAPDEAEWARARGIRP